MTVGAVDGIKLQIMSLGFALSIDWDLPVVVADRVLNFSNKNYARDMCNFLARDNYLASKSDQVPCVLDPEI